MAKGIYLVANLNSQKFCENLIYSIRRSGCSLPIRLIHFGGDKIDSPYIKQNAEFLELTDFPIIAIDFITRLADVLNECPKGFLYRFLPWFYDWDEFIYTDNDVVALANWEILFDYLKESDLVHADEEYTTGGIYNYKKPLNIIKIFGHTSLETAITAGHFASKKSDKFISDLELAIDWFKKNSDIPKKHDQSLLHVASLIGKWKITNLCKSPHNWISSWAGDHINALDIIHKIQSNQNRHISHLHYSGGTPDGRKPIDELLFSNLSSEKRMANLFGYQLKFISGLSKIANYKKRIKRRLKLLSKKN